MNMILKEMNKEIVELNKMLKKVDDYLKKAPVGTLKYKRKKGKIYYYQQIIDGKIVQKYIKRKNESMARALAQKSYFQNVKPILQKQLNELIDFVNSYNLEKLEEAYDTLSDIRKEMVVPLKLSREEIIRRWNEEIYEENNKYTEGKIYETEQGEFVRKVNTYIENDLIPGRDLIFTYESSKQPLDMGNLKKMMRELTLH